MSKIKACIRVGEDFLDALPPEKSIFIFIVVNVNLHSTRNYRRVFGQNYLASYWSGGRPLLPIGWKNLQIIRWHL